MRWLHQGVSAPTIVNDGGIIVAIVFFRGDRDKKSDNEDYY